MSRQSVPNAEVGRDTARANLLTNGGMAVWQRGSGPFTVSATYSADRWQLSMNGTSTVSVTRQTSAPPPANTTQSVLQAVYTHNAASAIQQLLWFSTDGFRGLAGRQVSISMAVFTGTAGAVRVALASDGTGALNVQSTLHPGDSTWRILTATGTVPTDASWVGLQLLFSASCTALAANAMLVVGSVPADYAPLHPADDLARCLRYYELLGQTPNTVALSGWGGGAAAALQWFIPFKAIKAVAPTVTKVGTWAVANTAQPVIAVGMDGCNVTLTATATGTTATANSSAGNVITLESNP